MTKCMIKKYCLNCSNEFIASHFAMEFCHGCMHQIITDEIKEISLEREINEYEKTMQNNSNFSKGGDLYE